MIVDLHAHYPMHLDLVKDIDDAQLPDLTLESVRDWVRALVLKIINSFGNYPKPWDPAVTIDHLLGSPVRVVLSVLYSPFDEMDLSKKYGSPPDTTYFQGLIKQLDGVRDQIDKERQARGDILRIATNAAELTKGLNKNQLVLIHAVEGGFHLGDADQEVTTNVKTLADRGVAYITVAHLFWRQVATNAPALPFLDDDLYRLVFPEDLIGLSTRGEKIIRAMIENGILVDVTHMSDRSIDNTLDLFDELDPGQQLPVLATHGACRFNSNHEYNLSPEHIARIAKRGGVIGLIVCKHWMADRLAKPQTIDESLDVIRKHIDEIFRVTKCYDHIAIGSDLDGFIKPTLPGLDYPERLMRLENDLAVHYTAEIAAKICSDNALRVLLHYWRTNLSNAPGK